MYESVNILPDLLRVATKFAMKNDRELYNPYFEVVEQFCIDHGVLLGGKVGIDLLLDRPLTKESYTWDLYTNNTFERSKDLAKKLSEVKSGHIDSRLVYLKTDIKHKEFTIFINLRPMIKIYNMDQYRGVDLQSLIGPVEKSSYFLHKNIKCISEEMQLIEVYRTLYTPAKVGQWPDYFAIEQGLYESINNSIRSKVMKTGGEDNSNDNNSNDNNSNTADFHSLLAQYNISGGGESEDNNSDDENSDGNNSDGENSDGDLDNYDTTWSTDFDNSGNTIVGGRDRNFVKKLSDSKREFDVRKGLEEMLDAMLIYFVSIDAVIIGDIAIGLLKDVDAPLRGRMQVITDKKPHDICSELEAALNDKFNISKWKLTYVKYSLNLPNDFQIIKHSIYAARGNNSGSDRVALLDMFNSTEFEMIPYRKIALGTEKVLKNTMSAPIVHVGNPLVIIRFKFIDLWVLKLIDGIEKNKNVSSDDKFVYRKMVEILDQIVYMRTLMNSMLARDPTDLFQLEDYSGMYISDMIAKKKIIKAQDILPIYYPAVADRC